LPGAIDTGNMQNSFIRCTYDRHGAYEARCLIVLGNREARASARTL